MGGEARDASTYLLPPGAADVFFPTDFGNLARLIGSAAAAGRPVQANENNAPPIEPGGAAAAVAPCTTWSKTRWFMRAHAERGGAGCACVGGYNPLLEDFENTSVLAASTESRVCKALHAGPAAPLVTRT